MITLITGLPGACKTLYTLNYVKAKAEKENRPVFYNGIPELTLPWEPLENPEKWHELPEGAIIVIDECQRVFRPRASSAAVPEHVEKFETHRHRGYDIFLITQHPMLLDGNVRRLSGQHFHCVRTFGLQRSTIHEWQQVKENCDKQRKDSVRHEFSFPKESFNWYKSATVHTHQARIPAKVFFLFALPFVILGALYYMWSFYQSKTHPEQTAKTESKPVQSQQVVAHSRPVRESSRSDIPRDILTEMQPRVPGLPHTAPYYDRITAPVDAPVPAACVMPSKKEGDCRCYTQQGTRMPSMDQSLCKSIVENGFFIAWQQRKEPEPAQKQPQQASDVSGVHMIPSPEKPGNG